MPFWNGFNIIGHFEGFGKGTTDGESAGTELLGIICCTPAGIQRELTSDFANQNEALWLHSAYRQ
ncbi:hypothetical protein [Xenorhabdus sp. KJ12.1]|uniref:hypothetical protein n=1 Tax=Xenorhabdus sp. KJ12.1 TaxID=1851571 RepID=UPI000C0417A6|nr:hypothetical protein [Xenorhabdus sp. KJ12.1]